MTAEVPRSPKTEYDEYRQQNEGSVDGISVEGDDEQPRSFSPPISAKVINNNNDTEKSKLDENSQDPVDPASLDWDGPDDPDDPKNWPLWLKCFTTLSAGLLCLIVTFGSSVYTTGLTKLMKDLDVSETLGISGLTFYLLGLSLGPLLGAPLSENFGRKPVYIVSTPLSMLFIMGVGLSKRFREVAVTRFFAGFFASPAMAVAGGTVSDIWSLDLICFAMCAFSVTPFVGTIVGPIIGGFVEEVRGWQWTMWLHLILMGGTVPFTLFMPETFKPAILKNRAKKRGVVFAKSKVGTLDFIKASIKMTVLRPMIILVTEPTALLLSIYTAFVFSILFAFFEAYPLIFRGVYGMSLGTSGLPFLGIGVGLLAAALFIFYVDRTIYFPKQADGTHGNRNENGKIVPPKPEALLLTSKYGAVLFPIALFWQGWTARESIHWIVPLLAGVPFGFSVLTIFMSILLYFSFSYSPLILASVISANNLLRYAMAGVFPLFTIQTYHNLGIGWASSLFGFIALLMMPLPFIFDKYGAQLRAKSRINQQVALDVERAAGGDGEAMAELELARSYTHTDN